MNSMFVKRNLIIAFILLLTFIVNNPDVSAYSDDVSVWDFVPEERICKVSELRNSSDYLMNPELTVIKNGSIGESKLAFFTDQEKMRANQILNIDSLRFDDDETKIRYIKKLSDFCNAPGPDFFVDKMVLPFLSLDFRIAGSTTLSSYTIGDLFESYDNIEKDCLYIVFDNDDCFIFNYYRQKDGSHILLPWESQPGQSPLESDSASIIQNIAQYRDMIWYYKEIQQQLNSTITRVLYAESGLKDTVIMYMTDKGAMAQLINGDNYVLLSENELKEIYSEYVANRDLQPGLQYGTGNRRQITKEYTQKSRITIGVISAAAVLCTAIVVMFLYKNHTRKAKLAQKSFSE